MRLGALALVLAAATCAGQSPQDPAALRQRLWRDLHRGDVAAVERELSGRERDPGVAYFLGAAAAARGQLARADSLFAWVASSTSSDLNLARASRAELLARQGRAAEARTEADALAGSLERNQSNPAGDWLALGIAYRILGETSPQQFKDALAALDRAVAADSGLIEAHLLLGELFLQKYVAPEARAAFREAARRDPGNGRAALGLVEVAMFEGDPRSYDEARKVLAAAASLPRAHALMARLDLDAEAFDSAVAHAARAITLDSTALDAWAIRGAALLLRDDTAGFAAAERAVRSWHRAPAGFYADVAEAFGRQRRYAEAVRLAQRGLALDSTAPAVLTALGVNELRTGAIESGRAHLERAFQRDPYHIWTKNTLDLLDATAKYRTVTAGRFVFVAAPEEADLLALYLPPLLERAYDSLAARYQYRAPTPVRLEIYRSHADFSVRTVGLAGIGALGVSFGSVLAMDAPSARPAGSFNWGSTAWHELTHAFTLGVSAHRVPRWLSEGLSVLEERRANPGWGAHATIPFLSAYKGGLLRPVSRLNEGFVRPRYVAEVPLSYYLASLACEYLEQTRGIDVIRRMLLAYRDGLATDAVIRRALAIEPTELDRRFDEWLKARFATPLKSVVAARDSTAPVGELETLIATGAKLAAGGKTGEAIATLERADRIFPDQGDAESAAWLLAGLHQKRGDLEKAAGYLARVTRNNESHVEANRLEAELKKRLGDRAGALAALERVIFIQPYDPAVHAAAAGLAADLGNHGAAIRERRAIVALAPSDRAEALYELAVALKNAGDRAAARREVLRALELAPAFERAQMLLLELRGAGL